MKIALLQTSPVVGDLAGNVVLLLQAVQEAKQAGAELAVASELAICAYPPRDYLDRPDFVVAQRRALDDLARQCPIPAIVGFVDQQLLDGQPRLLNAAALLKDGIVADIIHKTLLPTYDVFDEARYFTPATTRRLLHIGGYKVGVSICEDIWNDADHWEFRRYAVDPIDDLAKLGADLLINISASPFAVNKRRTRVEMLCAQAKRHGLPLLAVNQVGAHDDLIFDGGSIAIDATGAICARALEFQTDNLLVDVAGKTLSGPIRPQHAFDSQGGTRAGLDALIMGLRHYVQKCGFRSVALGLSGGIDSALTAAVAAAALGPENVYAVALPSRYSSEHSLQDAQALADAMGIHYQVISIEATVATLESTLAPCFSGTTEDVTEENIQARARGILLMAISNKFGHLLLNTGNKSEIAVGYCTLYGDMCGGLSILSDVFKTEVYRMSEEINRRAGRTIIPESTLNKAPSAELRPEQFDEDSLPPYKVLDALLERFIEQHESVTSLAQDFSLELVTKVVRMIHRAEFKRYQLAPGLKIRPKSFGPGRRMPIAAKCITDSETILA